MPASRSGASWSTDRSRRPRASRRANFRAYRPAAKAYDASPGGPWRAGRADGEARETKADRGEKSHGIRKSSATRVREGGACRVGARPSRPDGKPWRPGGRSLGTRTVRLSNDLDIVPVTFLSGSFTHLQLRVHGNAVTMNELRVRFSNGQWATLPVARAHSRRRTDARHPAPGPPPVHQHRRASLPLGAELARPRDGGNLGAQIGPAPNRRRRRR